MTTFLHFPLGPKQDLLEAAAFRLAIVRAPTLDMLREDFRRVDLRGGLQPRRLDPPVDVKEYPRLFIQYRADRLIAGERESAPSVLLLRDRQEGEFIAVWSGVIIVDGDAHELSMDLSAFEAKDIEGLAFQILANEQGNGSLHIEKFMFLGEPNWERYP